MVDKCGLQNSDGHCPPHCKECETGATTDCNEHRRYPKIYYKTWMGVLVDIDGNVKED